MGFQSYIPVSALTGTLTPTRHKRLKQFDPAQIAQLNSPWSMPLQNDVFRGPVP